ncbi:GTP pyrophosphokinase, partial [Streptococcus oralis]|uniref:GTP pyrophosphokinase n=1 Tax=Streptococcus oralis TaxID=1303 RepID=UPI0022848B04
MNSIYDSCEAYLPIILQTFIQDIEEAAANYKKETNLKLYEHLNARIKTEKSMREKCQRKGLPQTSQSALKEIRDAIGVRIITGFTDDIYRIVEYIRQMPSIHIFKEKDYIRQVKPNGYRSYHLILEVTTPYPDCLGNDLG